MRERKKGSGTGGVMVTTRGTILEAGEGAQDVGEVDGEVVEALTIEEWINFEVVAEEDGEDLRTGEGAVGEAGMRGATEGALVTMTSEVGAAAQVEAGVVEMIAWIGGIWTMSGQKTLLMTSRSSNSKLMGE